jgi:hypothetical protein
VPLASLASARLTALYRELEASGRRDRNGERTGLPLSPWTGQLSGERGAETGAALLRVGAILDPAAPRAGPGVDRAQAPCQGKLLGCMPGTDEAGTIRRDHGGLHDAVHRHDDRAAGRAQERPLPDARTSGTHSFRGQGQDRYMPPSWAVRSAC